MSTQMSPTAAAPSSPFDRAMSWGRPVALGLASAVIVTVAPPVSGLAGLLAVVAPGLGSPASVTAWILGSIVIVALALRFAPRLTARDRRAIAIGYVVGVAGYLSFSLAPLPPDQGPWRDAWNYFGLGVADPYARTYAEGGTGYLPPFFQLVAPLRELGWPGFLAIWSVAELAALWFVVGPLAPAFLLVPLVGFEVWNANINILLAAAIAAGFRHPITWSFVLLTKFTLGIGLLWFALRRDVRRVGVALGATAAIALASLALAPGLWQQWGSWLLAATESRQADAAEFLVRFAIAAAIVVVGARTGRAWLVPIAAVVALPVVWPSGLTILLACVPAARRGSIDAGVTRGR